MHTSREEQEGRPGRIYTAKM